MADLYLECYGGISGDMTVAALLDLGADQEHLKKALASLPLSGYEVKISRVKKSGIDAMDFDVVLQEENHDHDTEYLYGHKTGGEGFEEYGHHEHEHHHGHGDEAHHGHEHHHGHDDEAYHDHVHHHSHDHDHEHEHYDHAHHSHHEHHHRTMSDIRGIIEGAELSDGARELTLKIFEILVKAEAKAHGIPEDEVHFHEVGAVDSIVDITAAAVCIDDLRQGEAPIHRIIVPALYEGTGTVRTQHGVLPVPVPAVVNIASMYGIPMEITKAAGEYVTPTGAAIAAALRSDAELPPRFTVKKIGLGAGKRKQAGTGLLRAMLIE